MHDLKIYSSFTVVGIKERVVFVSSDGRILHEIVLSPTTPPDELAKAKEEKNGDNVPHSVAILALEYCTVSKVLTVSRSDKSLQSYQLKETDGQLSSEPLGERIFVSRIIACMKFAPKHGVLFGCEKGDCFEFDPFGRSEKPPKWVLGHMSQILDLAVSEDERFIITCDRDEKIKVTSYPDSHNIVCYCLGHHEYVGGIALLSSQTLLSVSGDKMLRLWNYGEGTGVASHTLEDPALGLTLQRLTDGRGTLCAVRSYVENKIEVIQINTDEQHPKCTPCETLSLDTGLTILNATLSPSCELVILAIYKESKAVTFRVYAWDSSQRRFELFRDSVLQKNLQNHFRESKIETIIDHSTLFKNTIDNLSDYFERKKLKIDSKKSK